MSKLQTNILDNNQQSTNQQKDIEIKNIKVENTNININTETLSFDSQESINQQLFFLKKLTLKMSWFLLFFGLIVILGLLITSGFSVGFYYKNMLVIKLLKIATYLLLGLLILTNLMINSFLLRKIINLINSYPKIDKEEKLRNKEFIFINWYLLNIILALLIPFLINSICLLSISTLSKYELNNNQLTIQNN